MSYRMEYARSVPDAFLYELFEGLVQSGRFKETFYDGVLEESHHAFRDYMKHDELCHAWVLLADNVMVGMAWLTNVGRGGVAQSHFFFLPVAHPLTIVRIARFCIASLLRLKDEAGEYVLHCVHGVTPVGNTEAVRFITKVGFQIVGEVPCAAYAAWRQGLEAAKVSYCTRETAPEQWLHYGERA